MENKEIIKILEAHKEWIEHPEKSKGKVNELILAQAIGFAVSKLNLLTIPDVVGQSEQLPCGCDVKLAETTLQVYCPKCYKTYKMK